MKWKKVIPAALLLSMAVASAAFAADRQVTVMGTGASRQAATVDGLIRAVGQVTGTAIEADQQMDQSYRELVLQVEGDTSQTAAMSETIASKILLTTRGIVERYQVLSATRDEESGLWEAELLVDIARWEPTGDSNQLKRPNLAVIPFHAREGAYNFGRRLPAAELARQLNQRLVSEFVQSRKFAIVGREYGKAVADERAFILSGNAAMTEYARIGQQLGADLLVVGSITAADLSTHSVWSETLKENLTGVSASFSIDFRVIEFATRQIKWSNTLDRRYSHQKIAAMANVGDVRGMQAAILADVAHQIADECLEGIFPVEVLKVQANGDLILNCGGIRLKAGEVLEVYNLGDRIEEDSGEFVGREEIWIGQAKVHRLTPKMAYARLLKGDPGEVARGAVCRMPAVQTGALSAPVRKLPEPSNNW